MKCLILLILCGGIFALVASEASGEVRFPDDAGVLDVTKHGVRPNDGVDDTHAIQAILDAHPSGNHVFYFPNGIYNLSNTLRPALDDGVTKRNIFQGESEARTILRVNDDVGLKDAVIDYQAGPAQFFRNSIRDLTIEVGKGNPEASGVKFNASNQGTMRNVTIRALDGGQVGLDLSHSGEIGPLLIDEVTIEGFARGMVTRWQTASQTIVGLTLRGQREIGWLNLNAQTVFARGVRSSNECTAVVNTAEGRILLVDSVLIGNGAASSVPAIRNQKSLYLRNVDTKGYRVGVTNELAAGRGNPPREAGLIDEYWANGASDKRKGSPYKLFPSPDRMLALPVEQVPNVPWGDVSDWSGPQRFGGTANDGVDDTIAIQAAMDSATTVFLPRGTWTINGVVSVKEHVQRIIGTEARIRGSGWFRIGDGESPIVIERLEGETRVDHASNRTLALQHLLGFTYKSSTEQPGKLFLCDVVGNPFQIKSRQHVWARQLDIEGDIESDPSIPARIENNGGTLSILGFKTEDEGTHIITKSGGKTEVLGALHVGKFGTQPRYVTIDSSISASIAKGGDNSVVEIRNGEMRRGQIGIADVYVGFAE